MAKTRAEANPSKKSNKKKKSKTKSSKLLSGPIKKDSSNAKNNPFEVIWSRTKFDVLGRKRKGEQKRIGLARSLAIEKRNKTLLKEYEQSAKSSEFIDNRIGEDDETLPEFDKAIMRMQRERQLKLKKSSKYNLSDGEDEDPVGHEEQLLSKVDDFEDDISLDEDEDEDASRDGAKSQNYLGLHAMKDTETSLPNEEENIYKSKKQVMQEIILKSKFYKAQKAREKEENEHLLQKLDSDFSSLAQSEALLSLMKPEKINSLEALVNEKVPRSSTEGSELKAKESTKKEQPDFYEKLVKEMALDMRARPSDRTKTPEEIAQEERERLEFLEEERQKRMLASFDSDEDDAGDGLHKSASNKFRPASGDDLGDSFSIDEEDVHRKGQVEEIYTAKDEDDHDESTSSDASGNEDDEEDDDTDDESDGDVDSGGEMEHLSTVKDWEQSDDDDDDYDADAVGEELRTEAKEVTANRARVRRENLGSSEYHADAKQISGKVETLPFVIEAPKSLEELRALLDNRVDAEVLEAINRIRACNSTKLAGENKRKMQIFYGYLLQYFAISATRRPINFKLLNLLVKPLMEMSAEIPFYAALCARERLQHMRTQFTKELEVSEKSGWPSFKNLLLLRLWSMIFPCSDFRHVVMTPVTILMSEYLIRCRILSGRDIAVGTFLCSMFLSVTKQSRKFCPEALMFLQILLISALKSDSAVRQHPQYNHLVELKSLKPRLHINTQDCDVESLDILVIVDLEADNKLFTSDSFKASILISAVEMMRGFLAVYEGMSSFPEIFMPVSVLLREVVDNTNTPKLLQDRIGDVLDLIKKKVDEHQALRRPVQMRKEKPKPIKQATPKFEDSYVKSRDYDPDRERAAMKKLKKQLKREQKGASRELRKDNQYLSQLKERDRRMEEEERAESYGKARAFLQEQEHAFKSGQLGKGRKRRR